MVPGSGHSDFQEPSSAQPIFWAGLVHYTPIFVHPVVHIMRLVVEIGKQLKACQVMCVSVLAVTVLVTISHWIEEHRRKQVLCIVNSSAEASKTQKKSTCFLCCWFLKGSFYEIWHLINTATFWAPGRNARGLKKEAFTDNHIEAPAHQMAVLCCQSLPAWHELTTTRAPEERRS